MLSFWTCAIKIDHLMLIIDNAKWLIWLTLALVLFYVELNSQIRLRPDLSSEIWQDRAPAGFGKVKSCTSLLIAHIVTGWVVLSTSSSTSLVCQTPKWRSASVLRPQLLQLSGPCVVIVKVSTCQKAQVTLSKCVDGRPQHQRLEVWLISSFSS